MHMQHYSVSIILFLSPISSVPNIALNPGGYAAG